MPSYVRAGIRKCARIRALSIDEEGSRLLFQVISDSYETRSVVYTTNIEFSGWGRVLGDKNMAAALIDRTVHHGRLAGFEGGSYRSEHALMTRQPRKKGRRVPTAQFPLETSRLCCRKIVPILWTPTCRNTIHTTEPVKCVRSGCLPAVTMSVHNWRHCASLHE